MKLLVCCAVILIGFPLAQDVHAQGFGGVLMKALDVNGDGELSADEVANANSVLALLDDDGDGVLSKKELGTGKRFSDWDDFDDMDGFYDMDDMEDWDDGPNSDGDNSKVDDGKALDPEEVDFKNGIDTILDRETFKKLSAPGEEILGRPGFQYVKFQIEDPSTDHPRLYFINTKTHPAHTMFMSAIGKKRGPWGMRGALIYHPFAMTQGGKQGLYTFAFEMQDTYSFEMIKIAYDLLSEKSPLLKDHLAYDPMTRGIDLYNKEKAKYEAADLPVFLSANKYSNIGYLPLNSAQAFGRLQLMDPQERPSPRDIVIYSTLPNEMPRVAGVLTTVRQTPLSHVNLRAIQDKVPNAYVAGALDDPVVSNLIGKYVYYGVTVDGYELREATIDEVNDHFATLRPKQSQSLIRDLAVTKIRSFDQIGFSDCSSVGVKAANLATLQTFNLPDHVVPSGSAVPFYFYDAYMKHNDFYRAVTEMRVELEFQQNTEKRTAALKAFRKRIKNGEMPDWMMKEISELQESFPPDCPIRCRSSTNNEDLPNFSGAGLYDSFTHHPDEGHLSKSIKQVFASFWTFRAYEEREFYRIDHLTGAMGVLVHPSYKDEQANGVAVSEDIVYQTTKQMGRTYYVNVQVGEDMVTNPEGESIPEELLLSPRFIVDDIVVQHSNRTEKATRVLTDKHVNELRRYMKTIHREFAKLYDKESDDQFAIEIEFKVTSAGQLIIKQARPWLR